MKKFLFSLVVGGFLTASWCFYSRSISISKTSSYLFLENIEALARSESSNECAGCLSSLYICKYFGNWGGCLGSPTSHIV